MPAELAMALHLASSVETVPCQFNRSASHRFRRKGEQALAVSGSFAIRIISS
jgi:hypothetical protein